ncbi:MAG: hypothetical protein MI919_14050 [Holophagales bacterium]|nr:hypothetical protein [Holophagales bacterium]
MPIVENRPRPNLHPTPSPVEAVLLAGVLAFFFTVPALGQATLEGGELPVNTFTTDDQDTPTPFVAPDGTFMVVWESYGQDGSGNGVFAQRFDAAGSALGAEIPVSVSTAGGQEDADITRLGDGSFLVVWDDDFTEGDARGIFGRRLDAAGSPVGGELAINLTTTGDQNDPVVAPAAAGGFLVLWEDESIIPPIPENVVALRFDAAGAPVGAEIDINQYVFGDQEDIDIASDAAGNFVVVWESDAQDGDLEAVVARRLDPTGQPVGKEMVVNTYTTGNQDDPQVAVHPDGRFAVVWEDDTQDAGVDSIWARTFAADGTPLVAPFQVDADPGRQMNPWVAFDTKGQLVVAWDSLSQDGDGVGVVTAAFDPTTGERSGGEMVVNTTTAGFQGYPAVAAGEGGQMVIVWESYPDQDGSLGGVFGRRLSVVLFGDGFETGTPEAWTSSTP